MWNKYLRPCIPFVLITLGISAHAQNLQDTKFTLDYMGDGVYAYPLQGIKPITLEFYGGNKVAINAGCNSYFTDYFIQNGAFTLGLLTGNTISCAPETMNAENQFLKVLRSIKTVQYQNNVLQLFASNQERLRFTSSNTSFNTTPNTASNTAPNNPSVVYFPPNNNTTTTTASTIKNPLGDSKWYLTQVDNQILSYITKPYLLFEGASAKASVGCTVISGDAAFYGNNQIKLNLLNSTAKACKEAPSAYYSQDGYFTALASVASHQASGDTLILRTNTGQQLFFVRPTIKTLYIAPTQPECPSGTATCYNYKTNSKDPWQLFPHAITGFKYQAGYTYKLQVTEKQNNDTVQYSLVKITLKKPSNIVRLYLAPKQAPCLANPARLCLAGKYRAEDGYGVLDMEGIAGFRYEKGYSYVLDVQYTPKGYVLSRVVERR